MTTKTKIFTGILVFIVILTATGWWIWNHIFIEKPLSVCGPKEVNKFNDVSFCNKSCQTDDDCKFTCGCGAININETCHDKGTIYDCVDHDVKCENSKCITGEEKKPEKVEAEATKLTLEELENAEYSLLSPYQEKVRLKDGYYSGELSVPYYWKREEVRVTLDRGKLAFGDLNNDGKEDAAVILVIEHRRTDVEEKFSRQTELTVMLNEDGKPIYHSYLRPQGIINSIVIQSGEMIIDFLLKKGEDCFDCTSDIKKTLYFRLSGNQLWEAIPGKIIEREEELKKLLPPEAMIIETQKVTGIDKPNRLLVLWMISPKQGYKIDEVYTCPDYAEGSVYSGPTRVSLVDTKEMNIINTVKIFHPWPGIFDEDSISISYRIRKDMWYRFYFPLRELEGATDKVEIYTKIMQLMDYNGDGKALEFALLKAAFCMGWSTTLIGYSEKQDKVIIYPIETSGAREPLIEEYIEKDGKIISYWADYLFYEKPQEPGYWKYEIDYRARGGCLDKHEVRYNEEKEVFEQKLERICENTAG